MIKKETEKELAVKLRKNGQTYSEILKVIPVAKSTLSLWLREVGISEMHKQSFSAKKRLSAMRGGQAKKKQRIEKQNKIISKAKSEITGVSLKELFLIGAVLYWAEGAKEKEYHPGSQLQFSNMDTRMIQVFLVWLLKVCKISKNMIVFNIFLHKSQEHRLEEVKKYWAGITGFSKDKFDTVYWKKNKLSKTSRKNTGEKYYGVLKIKVRTSSDLVRKIAGWTDGIFEKINSVK
ncbi:MAG: hypothetical protein V4439_02825 [Patescibacteria group bacterium]